MSEQRTMKRLCAPVVSVRVPQSDMDKARQSEPPKAARSEQSRMYALFSAAILEKLCRSSGASVSSRRTIPYVLSTSVGRTALSVVVSAIRGSCVYKHMIIPDKTLRLPAGVDRHILVCAFVSKCQREREKGGGLNTRLAGWVDADDVMRLQTDGCRANSMLRVHAVPVTALNPIHTLRAQIERPADKGGEDA